MPDTRHAYEHLQDIYFPIAIGVFALVAGSLAFVLFTGSRRPRAGAGSEHLPLEIGYGCALALAAAFLVWTTFRTETPIDRTVSRPALRIAVTAGQWSWTFRYPGGATVTSVATWHPPAALVPVGRVVEFAGTSRDVIHGLWVPLLHFQRQLLPGYVTRFDLVFPSIGSYGGACSVFCGERHSQMHFELRAVSAAQFERWLAATARSS